MVVTARADLLTSLAALVFHDAADGAFSDAVFASKGSIGDSARRMPLANLLDLCGAEFCAWMPFGSTDVLRLGQPTGPTTSEFVVDIAELRPKVQMVRIDTPAVLPAGTTVKHPHSVWYQAAMQKPGYPGHADGLAIKSEMRPPSVMVAIPPDSPAAVFIGITNEMSIKTLTQRWRSMVSGAGSTAEPTVIGRTAVKPRKERCAALFTNRRRRATNSDRLFGHRSSLLRCHGTGRPARRCRPSIVPGMRPW